MVAKKSRFDAEPAPPGPALIGQSPEMQRVYRLIGQVAGSDVNVLVRGESGTGKELVVNAIHRASSRAQGSSGQSQPRRHPGDPARE